MGAAGFLAGAGFVALESHSASVIDLGEPAALLVTMGKICGLLAGSLLLLQFVPAARLKFLDRIFGLPGLLLSHRILGVSAVVLATLHPMLIFAPRSVTMPVLHIRIWPILVGVVLLIGLWTGGSIAAWRKFLNLSYTVWYRMHRVGMFVAAGLFAIHVWNVARDFLWGWPRDALIVAMALYAALFTAVILIKPWLEKKHTLRVASVSSAGGNAYAIELKPLSGNTFSYAPGQFAFVTFYSSSLPVERHPWTISSTPTRPQSLIFTIKCSGDFTKGIGRLKPGDEAAVDGPYGRFSYPALVRDPNRELIMIAGGVGVTPMLSMLRYMTDRGEKRKVILIWSNRTENDILCREELEGIEGRMENLTVRHVPYSTKGFCRTHRPP